MLKKIKKMTVGLAFVLAAGVTVNIYFPAAAIQKAADQIVNDVRGTQDEEKPQGNENKSSRSFDGFKGLSIGPRHAYAQINIEVSTPAIRNLKQAMKNRFPSLKPFYERGNIGENNVGLIEVRDAAALGLKEKADVARFADQENKDRRSLYSEIIEANKLRPESLPQVQKLFANSWRAKSQANWWVQNDNGGWEKKK